MRKVKTTHFSLWNLSHLLFNDCNANGTHHWTQLSKTVKTGDAEVQSITIVCLYLVSSLKCNLYVAVVLGQQFGSHWSTAVPQSGLFDYSHTVNPTAKLTVAFTVNYSRCVLTWSEFCYFTYLFQLEKFKMCATVSVCRCGVSSEGWFYKAEPDLIWQDTNSNTCLRCIQTEHALTKGLMSRLALHSPWMSCSHRPSARRTQYRDRFTLETTLSLSLPISRITLM